MKLTLWSTAFLAACALACSPQNKETNQADGADWSFDPTLENQVDSIVNLLTLEEKVALAHGTGKFWSSGVPSLGIEEVQYADGPLGVREEIKRHSWAPAGWTNDSASYFPAGGGLSAAWNVDLAKTYGECIGAETRSRNKDYLLAPAINIIRSPLNGRNYEYMSEDPFLTAALTVPYVQGVQSQDVAACVKHYAVNNQETDRDSIDARLSERALREIYLPGFKAAAIEGQAYSMMGAYNKLRGQYLCENKYMLTDILKNEWGFQGTVISDWDATHSTVASAIGGLDVEMGTTIENYDNWYLADPLKDSVLSGALSEKYVDQIAQRVIRVLLNIKKTDSSRSKGSMNSKKHQDFMYNLASESIVLLKNDNDILPLDKSKIKSLAVIGDNATRKHADGGFGAGVKVFYEISPLEGIMNRLPNVDISYAQGYKPQYIDEGSKPAYELKPNNEPDTDLIAEAVSIAKKSDAVIIVGGTNRIHESESKDRDDMDLPYGQYELIEAVSAVNKNTIVVLACGTIFDLRRVDQVSDGILLSWFNGSEGGNALADVIFGKVNPSGRLPFTIPKKLEDSPAHATNSFPGDGETVEYKEDILVGYRWFDTKDITPLFPFGFGLSYSDFEYSDITTDATQYKTGDLIQLSISVKNVGSQSGKEVIQVYSETLSSKIDRAQQELKGFTKVALESQESKAVSIALPVSSLAYYDEEKNQWIVEPGTYQLNIGSSSRDIRETIQVSIE